MGASSRWFVSVLLLVPAALSAGPIPGARPRFKSPLGLAVDAEGRRAYVALHTADALAVVDLKTGRVLKEIPLGQQADEVFLGSENVYVTCDDNRQAITVSREGHVVVNRSPIGAAPHEIRPLLDRLQGKAHARIEGASNIRGFALGQLTEYFVHQRPKAQVPATQVFQGWVFTNTLTVIPGGIERRPQIVILDEPTQGYSDPSDVVASPDLEPFLVSKYLYVACAGANVVLVLDGPRLHRYLEKPGYGYSYQDPTGSDDLTASRRYLTARLPTQANPRRLALSGDGKTLVVSNYLADSLTVIDAARLRVVRHIPLGGPPPDAARRGEILFNSGQMTFHGQFTCASCHPDGRSDGLVWDLERDGIGNFKRTKSLLGVKDTAPYGWHGNSPTLADRVQGTLRTLHRHEPTANEIEDLVAYLKTLPPPRPPVPKEADRPAIARGQALFEGKGECRTCHRRIGLDDGRSHDIGTRAAGDTQDRFDTPALRGLAQSPRYLHDGRSNNLEEVFTKYNPKHRHGAAHQLTGAELADLIAYLNSL
jgi:YVTN family beta-propeller protein